MVSESCRKAIADDECVVAECVSANSIVEDTTPHSLHPKRPDGNNDADELVDITEPGLLGCCD